MLYYKLGFLFIGSDGKHAALLHGLIGNAPALLIGNAVKLYARMVRHRLGLGSGFGFGDYKRSQGNRYILAVHGNYLVYYVFARFRGEGCAAVEHGIRHGYAVALCYKIYIAVGQNLHLRGDYIRTVAAVDISVQRGFIRAGNAVDGRRVAYEHMAVMLDPVAVAADIAFHILKQLAQRVFARNAVLFHYARGKLRVAKYHYIAVENVVIRRAERRRKGI